MEVKNVSINNLEDAIVASGYPMLKEKLTEDEFENRKLSVWKDVLVEKELGDTPKDNKHFNRSVKLANTPIGSAHDSFLRLINIQFDLECSNKMWVEFERYNHFSMISFSTMHKLKDFDLDKAYIEHVDPRVIAVMKELQAEYNANPTKENRYKMLYTNPCGMNLNARVNTNYAQLKTIYRQRCHHALQEWQDFCQWIETLPLAKELIINE